MNLKFFLILLTTSQFISCQSNKKSDTNEINQNGYSISYPSIIRLDESVNGAEFILFSHKKSPDDNFGENINLIIQNLENLNIDLNKFVEITENQIRDVGNLISSERIKTSNSEFHKLVYRIIEDDFDFKFIQYHFVEENKAYILTFTAESDEFDNYSTEMEKIMSSFRLR